MYDTLNLEHIQAGPYTPEAKKTRFDPEFQDSARLYVPEQRQEQAMFTHNSELEVAATAQKATELAIPAGNTFIVPQTPEQDAANQEAYMALTEKSNVVSIEQRRYAGTAEMHQEITNGGDALEMVRNAA